MMTKRLLLSLFALVLFAGSALAQTQTWQIDPAHSAAQFSVRHLGISTVRGAFSKVTGTVQYDPADVSKSVIDATIDTSSIDTRVQSRDNDLRGPNYFDVQKYPTITFKSKRVEKAGDGKLKVIGDLTIHGTTKEVTLDVDGPTSPIANPPQMGGGQRMGASATTTVNRNDFGVSGGGKMIGDDISITLDIEMVHKDAAAAKPGA
jgi:polyisoprenoid-binding protein YceI